MSDLDFSDEENGELEKIFSVAAKYVAGHVDKFAEGELLELYGWYKQSTSGNCEGSRPGIFQLGKRAKWDAWNKVRYTPQDNAMEQYIEIVKSKCPDLASSPETATNSWVSVSTLKPEHDDILDEDKTIFDHVQEQNFEKFLQTLGDCADVNELDDNGLSLIHWAADRGQDEMLRLLLKRPEVNVNVLDEDGQTPLHYAAFCGHQNCAEVLLDAGADTKIKDGQGQTCYDVAYSEAIRSLLTK